MSKMKNKFNVRHFNNIFKIHHIQRLKKLCNLIGFLTKILIVDLYVILTVA